MKLAETIGAIASGDATQKVREEITRLEAIPEDEREGEFEYEGYLGSGKKKGSYDEVLTHLKTQFDKVEKEYTEDVKDVIQYEELQQALPQVKLSDGITISEFAEVVTEQLPRMVADYFTLGAFSGSQIAAESYWEQSARIAEKKYGEGYTVEQLKSVIENDEASATAAIASGVTTAALERIPLGKIFKATPGLRQLAGDAVGKFAKKPITYSLVKGEVKKFARAIPSGAYATGKAMTAEGGTEFVQYFTEETYTALGSKTAAKFDSNEALESFLQGAVVGGGLPLAGRLAKQTAVEVQSALDLATKFPPQNYQKYANNVVNSVRDTLVKGEISETQAEELINTVEATSKANEAVPTDITGETRSEAVKTVREINQIKKETEGINKAFTVKQDERKKVLEQRLQDIAAGKTVAIPEAGVKEKIKDGVQAQEPTKVTETKAVAQEKVQVQEPQTVEGQVIQPQDVKETEIDTGRVAEQPEVSTPVQEQEEVLPEGETQKQIKDEINRAKIHTEGEAKDQGKIDAFQSVVRAPYERFTPTESFRGRKDDDSLGRRSRGRSRFVEKQVEVLYSPNAGLPSGQAREVFNNFTRALNAKWSSVVTVATPNEIKDYFLNNKELIKQTKGFNDTQFNSYLAQHLNPGFAGFQDFFLDSDGKPVGFVYLNNSIAKPDTPIHEYTHIFSKVMDVTPEGQEIISKGFNALKGTDWLVGEEQRLKTKYPHLKEGSRDYIHEVISGAVGRRSTQLFKGLDQKQKQEEILKCYNKLYRKNSWES